MTKVIIYNRVSTDEQADGVSLDSQQRLNEEFCHKNGLEVVASFTEDYTGTQLQRPELDKIRKMLRQGEANGLICWKSGRLARKSSVSMLLREEFLENEISLWYSSKGQVDLTDIAAMLIEDVEARMNEHWLKELLATMNSGKIEMIRQGSVMLHGQDIYGYSRYKDEETKLWHIKPKEEEAKIVAKIFHWYVNDWASIRGIVDKLTALGAMPPRGKNGWCTSTISRLLGKETYAGVWHWKQGTEHHIAVDVPPIISRKIWDKTQARLTKNKMNRRCEPKHKALLRRHISCGHCKYSGTVIATNHRYKGKLTIYLYYACPSCKSRSVAHYIKEPCDGKPTCSVPKLDQQVWNIIVNLLLDPVALEQDYQKRVDANIEKNSGIHTDIELVEAAISKREAELKEAIETSISIGGKRAQVLLQNKVTELEEDIDQLEQRRLELIAQLDNQGISRSQFETLQRYAAAISTEVATADFETKQRIIDILGVEVEIKIIDGEKRFSLTSDLGNLVEDEKVSYAFGHKLTNLCLAQRQWFP
ncbi:MAG: recombinase family protein [Chloroflexota bacterium]